MKTKIEISRTKVKEDYDPLVQIKKETLRVFNENTEKQRENPEKNPLLVNPLTSDYHNSNNKSIQKIKSPRPYNSESNDIPERVNVSNNIPEIKSFSNPQNKRMMIDGLKNEKPDYDLNNLPHKLNSESHICSQNAIYSHNNEEIEGSVVMTDFRFIFIPEKKKTILEDYFNIPLLMIRKFEKIIDKKILVKYFIEISTKDNRLIRLCILDDINNKLYSELYKYTFPKDAEIFSKFAMKYKEKYHPTSDKEGWGIYKYEEEYARQGIKYNDPKFPLRLIHNKNYSICETYPEYFLLPRDFSDEQLSESRNFRTKNRIPVFCWIHPKTKATLWRSSQTKSGVTSQRCNEDERLLKLIGGLSDDHIIIFDARPYLSAMANRLKGAGFENTDHYDIIDIFFCKIENIHCVRASLNKLFTLCKDEKIKFLSMLETTQWYDFIHLLLKSTVDVSRELLKKNSVLIHCSDGWDRATQLITLTEIIMDPYYRTIKGFIVLIEKDWLSFGHQFAFRSGLYVKEMSEDQIAPIFLQWLDCIHQLQFQFPNAFEFNCDLLIFLAHHLNTCLYGTFLYNHEKERVEKDAKNNTVSIWSDVYEKIHLYRNIFWREDIQELDPNFSQHKIRFWEEYFLRFNLNYITSIKKQQHERSLNNINYFFENNKKEDSKKIANQKNKIDKYEQVIREFCKLTFKNNLSKDLPEELKSRIADIVDYEELEHECKNDDDEDKNDYMPMEKKNMITN